MKSVRRNAHLAKQFGEIRLLLDFLAGVTVFSQVTFLSYVLILDLQLELIVFCLQVPRLLWIHGLIMMSPLFKAILKFYTTNHLFTYFTVLTAKGLHPALTVG